MDILLAAASSIGAAVLIFAGHVVAGSLLFACAPVLIAKHFLGRGLS